MNDNNILAVVLAGGQSKRFGEDKNQAKLGPLVGVLTAMKWIKKNNKQYQWIATFPSDTPFLIHQLLKNTKAK